MCPSEVTKSVRLLVIGQGGREHALVWKLSTSPKVEKVFCLPGNAGTANDGTNVAIPQDNHAEIIRFCQRERITFVIIGPEAPLVAGLADDLREAGIGVFGPSAKAAELEGSKVFCKQLMRKANVPTADFHVFDDLESAEAYLEAHQAPCVVKADGLAAGKGVIICDNAEEALAACKSMLVEDQFGKAGSRILIEERLVGQEASILAITDGKTIVPLETSQDFKRAYDDDQGPNTGGMGAYSPAPLVDDAMMSRIEQEVFIPIVHALRVDRRPFLGVLYAGLMITSAGPKVLEFNVRFGDPECQPLLMRLRTDLAELLHAAVFGGLDQIDMQWDERDAVCVVVASGGYPGSYRKGLPIRGLHRYGSDEDLKVFHAGTTLDEGRVVTSGGRVLGVTALGDGLEEARKRAYEALEGIKFTDMMFRADIAKDRSSS
ncbi:Phosphoribosylamine--glycine ligase [Planctomycetes bacterium Pan216]|uniref:Phosphoribosylamine--glycine ligase n=1 Tax=Kolteria novifilia TaxID=2527975 RepID=A0A518AX81_9BACT|nr:Phosphoribosylamine--glycine ligase [Planctomycetes bacterium Pan216]